MGWWEVSADTLARSRFVVSPLAETTACLISLAAESAAHPAERAWLDAHLPAYRARLAADPVAAPLVRAALGHHWIADYLAPAPGGEYDGDFDGDFDGEGDRESGGSGAHGETGEHGEHGGTTEDAHFRRELARVREVPAATVRADLAVSLDGPPTGPPGRPSGRPPGPLPVALADRADLAERTADLLEWVWRETVRPDWPRRRRVIEADMVARTRQLSRGGWAAAVADMRPGMRWLDGNRLQINAHDRPPRELSGAQMMFVPVTPARGWVSWDLADPPDPPDLPDLPDPPDPGASSSPERTDPGVSETAFTDIPAIDADLIQNSMKNTHTGRGRYAVVYPCSGALVDTGARPAPEALGALLGPARATVLTLLDTPKSTTQLVALTGQSLGSAGRHLKILLAARLVERRRAGRSVLYYRTPAGDTLVRAQRR